jgi:small subunit ribosomal protein S17
MEKTTVVAVETLKRHLLYGKVLRVVKKYKVHDPQKRCQIGDRVRIVESRPLSKEKRWVVAEVIEPAKLAEGRARGVEEIVAELLPEELPQSEEQGPLKDDSGDN